MLILARCGKQSDLELVFAHLTECCLFAAGEDLPLSDPVSQQVWHRTRLEVSWSDSLVLNTSVFPSLTNHSGPDDVDYVMLVETEQAAMLLNVSFPQFVTHAQFIASNGLWKVLATEPLYALTIPYSALASVFAGEIANGTSGDLLSKRKASDWIRKQGNVCFYSFSLKPFSSCFSNT